MILRSLTLENFGLYGGSTTFDLTPATGPDGTRPVILIGGRNGSGKTTFLEAVRLALYGQRALGARVGRAEYEAYLAGRVHRSGGLETRSVAAVELKFDYAEAGVVHHYAVRREWKGGESRVRETLRLEKDGKPVDSVPREEWHAFLQELVPPGVSQLFFFDGEKVQEIADADDDGSSLVEAVRGLLGIETIGRLRTDIGFFLARHRRNGTAEDPTGQDLAVMERDLATTRDAIEAAVGEAAELESDKEARARVLERARRKFVQEGGDLSTRRGELESRRQSLRLAYGRAEAEFRDLANGLFPFSVAPKLMKRFEAAVEERLRSTAANFGSGSGPDLVQAIADWRNSAKPTRRATWASRHWADLEDFAASLTKGERPVTPDAGMTAFASVGDLGGLKNHLLEARLVVGPRALTLGKELEAIEEELREVEGLLARIEAFDESAQMLVDEVQVAERRLAETVTNLAAADERLRTLRFQAVASEKKRERLLERGEAAAASDRRLSLAGKVGEALSSYEALLMARKVARLEDVFLNSFRELARKDDLLHGVSVDPATFHVRLIGKAGREIPKSSLSAGERQIFAVALLWSLARISGRPLPMIVDTPLARLDGEHRKRLVDRYFPAASHQVILLSTDEEVRGPLLRDLEPSVSHAYRIDYDAALERSVVVDGYFEGSGVLPSSSTGESRVVHQA